MPSLFWQLHHAVEVDKGGPSRPPKSIANHHGKLPVVENNAETSVEDHICSLEDFPSLESSFLAFKQTYPKFLNTFTVDDIRSQEYAHLQQKGHVCLDYCGFGLFSLLQRQMDPFKSSFSLSHMSVNLPAHATYGTADEGSIEWGIRRRIMEYLNINDNEYSMVFTASKRTAFKLLAESYNFRDNPRLITVYDHKSESVDFMVESAREKGAKIMSAFFTWPLLRICAAQLKKQIQEKKKKKGHGKGLFVFPIQSRLTGAKYSYQWMTLAEKHKWHVLLDASAMGPKELDSLGLSLFRPDFIICSFYKIFGYDPTGFGCLFIKRSSVRHLDNSGAKSIGLVRVVSISEQSLGSESASVDDGKVVEQENEDDRHENLNSVTSFSGLVAPFYKKEYSSEISEGDVCYSGDEYEGPYGTERVISTNDVQGNGPVQKVNYEAEEKLHLQYTKESVTVYCNANGNVHIDNEHAVDVKNEHGYVENNSLTVQEERKALSQSETCIPQDARSSSDINHQDKTSSSTEITELGGPEISNDEPEDERKYPLSRSHQVEDSALKRLSRDDGLIDSRENGYLNRRRFLPIREDIEEVDFEDNQERMQYGADEWTTGKGRGRQPSWDSDYYDDDDDDVVSDNDSTADDSWDHSNKKDTQVICSGLDHADAMGLTKTNVRLRSLINWLISSLMKLYHPGHKQPLVQIFGPEAKFDRGAALAFNLYDVSGAVLQPDFVQKLADRSSISLGLGFLHNIVFDSVGEELPSRGDTHLTKGLDVGKDSGIPVLTAALAFVSDFEDVYRLWAFVAKFLDADYVVGETLKYQCLNQDTITVTGQSN